MNIAGWPPEKHRASNVYARNSQYHRRTRYDTRSWASNRMTVRPFIPVPKVVSVELIYTCNGTIMENVLHVLLAAPASGADIIAIRTIVNSWDSTSWSAWRSNQVLLSRIRSKALDSLGSPIEDFTLPTARAGAQGGGILAQNVAWCVRLGTGLSGRSYRGRLYFPSITAAQISGPGQLQAATGNAIIASLGTLNTNLQAGSPSSKLVVVSYRNNGAWRGAGVATPITTIGYADLNLDSQRRRLPGRGI